MQQRSQQSSGGMGGRSNQTNFASRFVFPYDAEDIKAHRWFKGVPWERLHKLNPPFVPMIRSPEDTQYFDEDVPVTDFSDSEDDAEDELQLKPDSISPVVNLHNDTGRDGADDKLAPATMTADLKAASASNVQYTRDVESVKAQAGISPHREARVHMLPSVVATLPDENLLTGTTSKKRAERQAQLADILARFDQGIQLAVRSWLAVPYDSLRLRNFELQVDMEPCLRASERDALKSLVRIYGRKEKKRPRDKLLRDPGMKKVVLEERKKTAFMGYDWTRMQALPAAPILMTGPIHGPPACLDTTSVVTAKNYPDVDGCNVGRGMWTCSGAPFGYGQNAAMRTSPGARLSMN